MNKRKFLVCVDSDGCAIDSMTIKHKEAFGPALLEIWKLEDAKGSEVLETWNQINLYRPSRGINRFQGLVAILEAFPEMESPQTLSRLKEWTETTPALAPHALQKEYERTGEMIFKKALDWSSIVNQKIDNLAMSLPFEHVSETLNMIKNFADIAVVSSANPIAILDEWKKSGLYELTDFFFSQADGTKSQCIAKLVREGYQPSHILMLGDAIGDYSAAKENNVWFYPILAGDEAESWRRFEQIYFERFVNQEFNAILQVQLIEGMLANLEGGKPL